MLFSPYHDRAFQLLVKEKIRVQLIGLHESAVGHVGFMSILSTFFVQSIDINPKYYRELLRNEGKCAEMASKGIGYRRRKDRARSRGTARKEVIAWKK